MPGAAGSGTLGAMTRWRSAVLLGAAIMAAAGEAWARRTRATCEERRRSLPGDEIVPQPMWQATRATTIDAPPEAVWPWLVQMGFPTQRAGWYTPFWLDRLVFGIRARSADRIVPEFQQLAVGDRVSDSESGISYFTAERVDPPRALVLHSRTHLLPMYRNVCFGWAFVLVDAQPGTRLIMRARVRYAPVWPAALVRVLMRVGFDAGDVLQAGAMLNGIRRRAERGSAGELPVAPVAQPVRPPIAARAPERAADIAAA